MSLKLLEIVDVEDGDRKGLAGAGNPMHFPLQRVFEITTVEELGQRVAYRLMLESFALFQADDRHREAFRDHVEIASRLPLVRRIGLILAVRHGGPV